MTRSVRGALPALVLLLALAATPLTSQEPPTLDRVEELARLGRTAEAREVLSAWWVETASGGSRRDMQRAIWLRGRLTPDPAQAELDFRRLVVEYPGGPYSDQALLRLAQAVYAAGDSAEAAAMVERLGREYPTSPVRREAEVWMATAGPVPQGVTAGRPASPGVDTAAAAPPPTAEPAPVPPAGEQAAAAAPSSARFAVQLGAFSSRERAETVLRRVAEAGFEGRLVLVPGSDLVRVRVGAFDTQEGAGAILERLRERGFTAAVARDAHLETPVR